MGHIQRIRRARQGGTWQGWQARYRAPDGRERSRTFERKIDAEQWLAVEASSVARRAWIDPRAGRVTFSAFARDWAASRDWKATSREGWDAVVARLDPLLGPLPIERIDRLELERAQAELGNRYARSTVELTMSRARSVMKAAYATGRIGRDPTLGLVAPKVRAGQADGRVRPEDVPTRSEVLAILEAAPPRFRAALALGVTGLRIGEVIAVTVEQFDLERRLLTVDRQLQRIAGAMTVTTPKAEHNRTIVLPGAVSLEVRRHLREHQGDGLLFRGERGALMRRDSLYDSAWRPALVGAGLARDRFKFHALRHFAASQMLADGAPITAVAGHLGDTVETVQRTYAHWLRDDREVPARVLDRVLAPAEEISCGTNAERVAPSEPRKAL